MAIKAHIEDGTFVPFFVVQHAYELLQEHNIVVLLGPPGYGKSRISLDLLRHLADTGFNVVKLYDILEWNDIDPCNSAVLLDDVFGKTNSSYDPNIHSGILAAISVAVQCAKTKIIITMRDNIWKLLTNVVDSYRIFKEVHLINLASPDHQLGKLEKALLLLKYLNKNQIKITSAKRDENFDTACRADSPVIIFHQDTIEKILNADVGQYIGFPEVCFLFTSNRKFTRQGDMFFSHTTERLFDEIENMRRNGATDRDSLVDYSVLVYILLNGDSIDQHAFDINSIQQIAESVTSHQIGTLNKFSIKDSLNRLNSRYVQQDHSSFFTFQHRTIGESVMISYSVADIVKIVSLMSFNFIIEMTRNQFYQKRDGEVILIIPNDCYDGLAKRLIHLLITENMTKPFLFMQRLCNSKLITLSGENVLSKIIHQDNTYLDLNEHQTELIADQRFYDNKGVQTDPLKLFAIRDNFFYLPSTVLMFYASDETYIVTNTKELICSKFDKCQEKETLGIIFKSLFTALNFSISIGNVKRCETVSCILNIMVDKFEWLKVSKLSSMSIVRNAAILQGIGGLKILFSIQNIDRIASIVELTRLTFEIFFRGNITAKRKHRMTADQEQFILWLLNKFGGGQVDPDLVIRQACGFGNMEFIRKIFGIIDKNSINVQPAIREAIESNDIETVYWLIEQLNFDKNSAIQIACRYAADKAEHLINKFSKCLEIDFKSALNEACKSSNAKLSIWMLKQFHHSLFDLENAMNNACVNNVSEIAKWMFDNFDQSMFDMKSAINIACINYNPELAKWMFDKFGSSLFDMAIAMNKASKQHNSELAMWMLNKFDYKLFDLKSALNNACKQFNTNFAQTLLEKFDMSFFDMHTAMNNACENMNSELAMWMLKKFDCSYFNMKSALNIAIEHCNSNLAQWLMTQYDVSLFDMKMAMNHACEHIDSDLFDISIEIHHVKKHNKQELAEWMFEKFDYSMFDMKTALNNACKHNSKLAMWMLVKFDYSLFDMKSAMNYACENCNFELSKWMFNRFDYTIFDIKSAMNNACNHFNSDLAQWLFDRFDLSLFDAKTAMNNACTRNENLAIWMLDKFDSANFDMESVLNNACKSDNPTLAQCILDRFDLSLFDLTRAIDVACENNAELAEWMITKFDRSLFNIKSAMNSACKNDKAELAKWMFARFGVSVFDMKTAVNNACESNATLAQWMLEGFDQSLFDFQSAMMCARKNPNRQLPTWIKEHFPHISFDLFCISDSELDDDYHDLQTLIDSLNV